MLILAAMQDTNYRESIIEAARLLGEMENRLFTAMVNTGMCGVHKEIHQSFEQGDVFDFEISMFEDTGDANLEQFVGLLKKVASCRAALKNLNGLEDDELKRSVRTR